MKSISLELTGSQDLYKLVNEKMRAETGTSVPSESQALVEAKSVIPESVASNSMMSRNFVHAGDNQSEYIRARVAGNAAVSRQTNNQNAVLASAMAEMATLSDQGNYAMRAYIGQKAARRMMEEGQNAVQRESENNLKEIRKDIEKRAEQAVAQATSRANASEETSTLEHTTASGTVISEEIVGTPSGEAVLTADTTPVFSSVGEDVAQPVVAVSAVNGEGASPEIESVPSQSVDVHV